VGLPFQKESEESGEGPEEVCQESAAMWKSCGRELEAPEVSGANKKIPMKHLKGKKGKLGGMNPTTGMYLLMATDCSEGTGEEGGPGALPFTSRKHYRVKSCPLRITTSRSKAYG